MFRQLQFVSIFYDIIAHLMIKLYHYVVPKTYSYPRRRLPLNRLFIVYTRMMYPQMLPTEITVKMYPMHDITRARVCKCWRQTHELSSLLLGTEHTLISKHYHESDVRHWILIDGSRFGCNDTVAIANSHNNLVITFIYLQTKYSAPFITQLCNSTIPT